MRRFFVEPSHRSVAGVRILFGIAVLVAAYHTPDQLPLREILIVLMGLSMALGGGAEWLPRPWRVPAGVLRMGALLGWGMCVVVVLMLAAIILGG